MIKSNNLIHFWNLWVGSWDRSQQEVGLYSVILGLGWKSRVRGLGSPSTDFLQAVHADHGLRASVPLCGPPLGQCELPPACGWVLGRSIPESWTWTQKSHSFTPAILLFEAVTGPLRSWVGEIDSTSWLEDQGVEEYMWDQKWHKGHFCKTPSATTRKFPEQWQKMKSLFPSGWTYTDKAK